MYEKQLTICIGRHDDDGISFGLNTKFDSPPTNSPIASISTWWCPRSRVTSMWNSNPNRRHLTQCRSDLYLLSISALFFSIGVYTGENIQWMGTTKLKETGKSSQIARVFFTGIRHHRVDDSFVCFQQLYWDIFRYNFQILDSSEIMPTYQSDSIWLAFNNQQF